MAKVYLTFTQTPANPTSSTSATFAWSTSGTVSSTQCSLDGASYKTCATPVSYSGLGAGSHRFSVKASSRSTSGTASDSWTITVPADTTAPSVPTGLVASPGTGQVSLSWSAATDPDSAVAGYHVYRNGVQVAQVSGTSFTDSGLTGGTSYGYSVDAFDAAGNTSAQSAVVYATPDSAPTAPSPPACTIFVSPGGGGSGTSSADPTSFTSAIGTVNPGDVVCMEAGTYSTNSNIFFGRSGSSSAPITYRNYGGQALIQYTGGSTGAAYPTGGVLETSSGSNWSGSHYLVFDGLTIDGGNWVGGGISVIQGSHHITIENCVIKNTGAEGIELNAADYVTAENNQIYHVGYNQGWGSGISLWYGGNDSTPTYGGSTAWYDTAPGFHNYILGNIISGVYDNSGYHSDGNGIVVDGDGAIPPALIADNVTYENGGRGIEDFANSGDVWIINNTAYANGLDLTVGSGQAPDFMANQASNAHFVNDIAYGRKNGTTYTTAYTYYNSSSSAQWSRDLGYNGSTSGSVSLMNTADPLFSTLPPIPGGSTPWASATPPWQIGSDFALQANSPAVNTGIDPSTAPGLTSAEAADIQQVLATDVAGNPRTQGTAVDLGAYESSY